MIPGNVEHCPSAIRIPRKSDYLSRTTRQVAAVLAEHLRGDGTLGSGGGGGTSARAAVLECLGTRL